MRKKLKEILSKIEEPSFTFAIRCNLEEDKKELVYEEFLKNGEAINEEAQMREIKYRCITEEPERKWFEIEYKYPNRSVGFVKSIEPLELSKILGEDTISKFNNELMEKRNYFLN
ncbi:MAG: hypothetical protein WDZ62_01890 [Candidatus Pacearchaeota archaeon]